MPMSITPVLKLFTLLTNPVVLGLIAYYIVCMVAAYFMYRKSLLWVIGKYRILFFSPVVAPTGAVAWVISKLAGKEELDADLQATVAYGFVMYLYVQVALFALVPLDKAEQAKQLRNPASVEKCECVSKSVLNQSKVPLW